MKKICLFLICFFIFIINVSGSLGLAVPKEYIITINNINRKEIKKIEVLYKTNYQILYYEKGYPFRIWVSETDFGYKYKDVNDSEILPKLSTEELDEIYDSCYNNYKPAKDVKGYWLEKNILYSDDNQSNNSIIKYALYDDVKIEYNKDNVAISFPGPKTSLIIIKLEKKDGTILYSKKIESKLIRVFDEHSSSEEVEEALKAEELIAQFEVNYKNITDNFDVLEIDYSDINEPYNKEENTIDKIVYISILIIAIIIFIIGLIGLVIIKRDKNKNKNK